MNTSLQLYLLINKQQAGPFTEEQVRAMVTAGSVSEADYCWHEGITDWQPLNTVIAFTQVQRPIRPSAPLNQQQPPQVSNVIVQHEVITNVKQGAIIGGWVCFVLGMAFMYFSMWSFIIYGPLFLVAFILSIVAMSQRRIIGGIALLLSILIVPTVLGLYLFVFRTSKLIDSLAKPTPSPSPTATASPVPIATPTTPTPAPSITPTPTATPDTTNTPTATPAAAVGVPVPTGLVIVKATYAGGDVHQDVTSFLAMNVQGTRLQMRVGNDTLGGDPAFGKSKTLTVLYQNEEGFFTITAKEGDTLELPNTQAMLVKADKGQFPQEIIPQASTSKIITPSIKLPLAGQEFTTLAGEVYTNVTVKLIQPDGIVVTDEDGVRKLKFDQLPKDVRIKYGYDPSKAAEFEAAVQASEITSQQQEEATQAAELEAKKELEKQREEEAATPTPAPHYSIGAEDGSG